MRLSRSPLLIKVELLLSLIMLILKILTRKCRPYTTYTKLSKDPTCVYKQQLINIINTWQENNPISDYPKRTIHPTSEEVPKVYGTPKIHKPTAPLRPEVSSIGSISYGELKKYVVIVWIICKHTVFFCAWHEV